jgi:Zn-dependent peptidase ImmA (M78 family)
VKSTETEAEHKAIAFRDRHGLGLAPIRDLVALAENRMGLDLVFEELPAGIDALTTKDGETGKVFVAVAATENLERQRFTIAHEIGHIEFGDLVEGFTPHENNFDAEDRAHTFARHLLIPREAMHHLLAEVNAQRFALELHHLSSLVQFFGVSPTVAAIQLREESWISDDTFSQWEQETAPRLSVLFGWDAERKALLATSAQKRPSQRLTSRAVDLYGRGLVAIEFVASVTGRPVSEVEADMKRFDIEPAKLSSATDEPFVIDEL